MELLRVKGHRKNASRNVLAGRLANAPVRSVYQSIVATIGVGDTAIFDYRNTALHTSCADKRQPRRLGFSTAAPKPVQSPYATTTVDLLGFVVQL